MTRVSLDGRRSEFSLPSPSPPSPPFSFILTDCYGAPRDVAGLAGMGSEADVRGEEPSEPEAMSVEEVEEVVSVELRVVICESSVVASAAT